jgi:hypothetical protein
MRAMEFVDTREFRRMRLRHRTSILTAVGLSICLSPAWAQHGPPPVHKKMTASRVPNGTIDLDGRLDEAAWHTTQMVSDFTQKEPNEGTIPHERTEVGFLYDDEALYIGGRMYSDHPDSLRSDVNKRDNPGNSEQLIISIDTYFDHRTCWDFGVSVAGVRSDRYHATDDENDRDFSFTAVWDAETQIDSLGWTCEMRVPLSQLRFINKDKQIWGVNLDRWIPMRNEDDFWIAVPKQETGWSSWFGELYGIEGITPPRRLELLPYAASDASFTSNPVKGDPFNDGTSTDGRVGTDLKMGLGPNMTLDATINPDFGQVEADPAVVNLSAFETAFEEKRPFFIEGSQLFTVEGPLYFYSRRIGAAPRGDAEGDFVDYPNNTTILGAAKVTGRTESGLSLGLVSAVTARESARVYDSLSGKQSSVEVQAPTGLGVVRLRQEFGASHSTAGILLTGTRRSLNDNDPLASILRKDAIAGNADWNLRFKGGAYDIIGYAGFSHVDGTRDAILAMQTSSARYYQRPDAHYVHVDSSKTSLSGYTFGLRGGKRSGRHWLWGGGFSVESPGFDVNDAGIIQQVDDIEQWNHIEYREQQPGRLLRNYDIVLSQNSFWNFSAVKAPANDVSHTLTFYELNVDVTFKNFWGAHYYFGHDFPGRSDILTRGGPLMGTPPGLFTSVSLSSNFAKPTTWSGSVFYHDNNIGGVEGQYQLSVGGRVGRRVSFSVAPTYYRQTDTRQYITTVEGGSPDTYGKRYVFGRIYETQLSAQFRLNYFFTPNLSLECYAEPFAASGKYSDFGELPTPSSHDLRFYGSNGSSINETSDGHYVVDDALGQFEFDASDFGYRSFRSNVVLRWEFRSGSTLYLVWQQNREGDREPGRRVRLNSLRQTLSADGDNFLALKISYWIPAS